MSAPAQERVPGDDAPPVVTPPPRRPPPRPHTDRPIAVRGVWAGVARSARVRILLAYIVMLAIYAVGSMYAIHQLLVIRLDDQVNDALEQEVVEFEKIVAGDDPKTGRAFTSASRALYVFLERQETHDDEALLGYSEGKLVEPRLISKFPIDPLPQEQEDIFREFSRGGGESVPTEGTFETKLGTAHYRMRRAEINDTTGALAVIILPVGEREEIGELQRWGILATLGVLLIASVLAYLVAGRALAPVRLLTEAAHSISTSDLTRRISVTGAGDAAEMAKSFNAMLDRLEGTFRSQRAFIQDTSHELRDPLTIARGHLELLGDDPEERQRTLALVLDELDRMARIVDDLQLLSDAEQPGFLRPEWIDLASFTGDLLAKATALAPRDWRLDESGEGMFVADRHGLTEAVMNLAHNAAHHTDDDAVIAIGSSIDADEVRIWVRDTGKGIALSDQSRIFERFTRGRDSNRRHRGSGLGLAIVRALAEAHAGRVELQSGIGSGSKFTIVVPRYQVEDVRNGQDPDRRG